MIADYEATLVTLLAGLNRDNHAIACDIAVPPEIFCGFGLIKEKNLEKAKAREAEFLDAYRRRRRRILDFPIYRIYILAKVCVDWEGTVDLG